MKLKTRIAVALLTIAGFTASAQMADYAYMREIIGVSGQWNTVVLPDEIFAKISPNFNDIRIYGITEGKDSIETPFILNVRENKKSVAFRQFKAINSVHNAEGSFFTFELSDEETINQIQLIINRVNFDWKVRLEGSQNQNEWFTILDDYRILSIRNEQTEYAFTKLVFPDSKYRYYRVFVPSYDKIDLQSELLYVDSNNDSTSSKTHILSSQNRKENKAQKQTEIEINLQQAVPVNQLKIDVAADFDYYRPFSIQYLADSVKTENGMFYTYNTLYTGTLNSIDENVFTFQNSIVKKLKIVIQNQDNQALAINNLDIKGSMYELIARFSEPSASYFLVYGNESARAPRYDLARFSENIPVEMPGNTLGEEIVLSKKDEISQKPLFENPKILWAIMIVIIGALGFFSVKMLRKS